jgi:hypothetical protein
LELRRQAAQTGWDEAEQQLALCDGGAGLEDFFRKNFPLATVILDFRHAKEHLVELGQVVFGEGSAEGQQWLDERCHQLKQEGGAAVLQSLESLDLVDRSDALRETRRRETGYFRNHQHKMDYPRYLAHGWQIGSGPVESAGAPPVATPSATSALSTSANPLNGNLSGANTPTKLAPPLRRSHEPTRSGQGLAKKRTAAWSRLPSARPRACRSL